MSYSLVSFEQTDVPIRKQVATSGLAYTAPAALLGQQDPRPANDVVSTALVVANDFVQRWLRSFLKGTRFQIVTIAANPSEIGALTDDQTSPALIIVVFDDAVSIDAIRALRTGCADAKLVILGRFEAPGSLPKDVCLTAQAVLANDIGQQTLISALDLVMLDVTVQSADLFSWFMDQLKPSLGESNPPLGFAEHGVTVMQTVASATSHKRLSGRELDVLRGLAEGNSNKLIARHYNLAEPTVKIHVKSVLRKLQIQNRTQAAVWAREHGIHG